MSTGGKNILMVFPEVPYPLRNSGLSLRYLPIIQYLSKRFVVDLAIIGLGRVNPENIAALKTYCRRVSIIQRANPASHSLIQRILTQAYIMLPWTPPNTFVVYGGNEILRQIRALVSESHVDTLLWVSGFYTPYLRNIFADRVIVDFIDSPSLSFERKIGEQSGSSLFHKYELWKMRRWEEKLIRASSATVYISPVDAGVISEKRTPVSQRHVIHNGISVEKYTPSTHPGLKSPNIGFLGNMSYPPNVEAVQWLYENVFLPLRSHISNLSFYVIGKDPDNFILSLGQKEGVTVTGMVDDIWPYINAVDLFIFPLWRGAGIKNKVLEAMYAKRPVITTRVGNEGIEAISGRDLCVCDTKEHFQKEALRLLSSERERFLLGESAHKFVTKRFSWDQILKEFEGVIAGEKGSSTQATATYEN